MPVNLPFNEAIKLAENTNYTNKDYHYLKNVSITEWDIQSAGLSVLKFKTLLPEEELIKLSNMEKHARTVYEGNLQRENPILAESIIKTLAQVRKAFVLVNQIPADNILSIKKDAIFLINFTPKITCIKEFFNFRKKGEYTTFLQINNKEFYFNSYTNILDVKGIDKIGVAEHRNFLLKDFSKFLKSSEKVEPSILYDVLKNYRAAYLNRELPVSFYRELDTGQYRMGKYFLKNVS